MKQKFISIKNKMRAIIITKFELKWITRT